MKKEEFIKKYREGAWKKRLQQTRDWKKANPEKAKVHHQEESHKGGKYYKHRQEYQTTGLQGERNRIRKGHAHKYHPFKHIIAPDSQIHHEWIPGTAEYRGVALVETNPHRYGIIDVIKILEGNITLQTEQRGSRG